MGELADVLRALGKWLDERHATGIEIQNHDTHLRVTWESFTGGIDQDYLEDLELEHLRAEARAMRQGGARTNPGSSMAELLRTLGQELDREEVDVATITQEGRAFRVSGQTRGRYFRQLYHEDQLMLMSWERRSRRSGARSAFGNPAARQP